MSDFATAVSTRSWACLRLVAQSFMAQWVLFVVPALYLLINAFLFSFLPHHDVASVFDLLVDLLTFSIPCGLVVGLVVRLVQYAVIIKPESPARALAQDVRNLITKPAFLINGLPIFIALTFYNKAMVELKPQIPFLNPFKWDETFMNLDRALHGGFDPWLLLQPVMGYPWITFLSSIAYDFWFVALFGSWVWFAFQKQATELRTRFFLSYMLIWWIGGGLLALAFSSAGPAYYSRIGLSPDPFTGLFAYLHAADAHLAAIHPILRIWSLPTQELLWNGYLGKSDPFGISAFPSMHNGSAVLFALAFRNVSKFWGRFFTAYALLILLTSVHLGWHYAVDGYAAILISCACWWLSKPIARFVHRQPAMVQHNRDLAALAS